MIRLSKRGRRWLVTGFSAALAAHALLATAFWNDLSQAFLLTELDYENARAMVAFQGMPMDQIGDQLDHYMATGQPVALDAKIAESDFLQQRFAEALYPRPVDRSARPTLAISGPSGGEQPAGTVLSTRNAFGRPLEVRLLNAPAPPPGGLSPAPASETAHPVSLTVACAAAALGLGLAVLEAAGLAASFDFPALLSAGLVVGSLVVGLAFSAVTWLQAPLPGFVLPALGALGLAAVGYRHRKDRPVLHFIRRFENGAVAAYLTSVLFRCAVTPVSLWDGRSIWLFQAKRLFLHGTLRLSELGNPETLWSHPDYPLLFPSWLAYFGGSGSALDERLATLGAGLLFCALVGLVWFLARERLGRWSGAAFTLALALAIDHATLGLYADGLLLLMLVAALLAWLSDRVALAWLLLAAAALTKNEGLVFAAALAATLWGLARKPRGDARRASLFALGAFLPALVHRIWIRIAGVDTVLKGSGLGDALARALPRLGEELALAPRLLLSAGYVHVRSLLWAGLAGLLVLAATSFLSASRLSRETLAITAAALVTLAFPFAAIAFLPENAAWFVNTALDRLLLLPAALLILAPLEANATKL